MRQLKELCSLSSTTQPQPKESPEASEAIQEYATTILPSIPKETLPPFKEVFLLMLSKVCYKEWRIF